MNGDEKVYAVVAAFVVIGVVVIVGGITLSSELSPTVVTLGITVLITGVGLAALVFGRGGIVIGCIFLLVAGFLLWQIYNNAEAALSG